MNAAKVKRNSLTGGQINEAKLGQVPSAANAARLDGKVPGDFLAAGGTAVNAEKLDGVDSAVFGNTQTYAGINFEPRGGTATKAYFSPGAISCVAGTETFTQRVQLPEGARITSIDFRYFDNEAGAGASLDLVAYNSFEQGGFVTETLASAVTTTGGARQTDTDAASQPAAVVDNDKWSYQLNWSPAVCSASMLLVGARVHYTLPTS